MMRYYKFREGAPGSDEGVRAEDVEVGDAYLDGLRTLVDLGPSERLARVRKMDLPPLHDEEAWKEVREVAGADVLDVMHNEAVQREIQSGSARVRAELDALHGEGHMEAQLEAINDQDTDLPDQKAA